MEGSVIPKGTKKTVSVAFSAHEFEENSPEKMMEIIATRIKSGFLAMHELRPWLQYTVEVRKGDHWNPDADHGLIIAFDVVNREESGFYDKEQDETVEFLEGQDNDDARGKTTDD